MFTWQVCAIRLDVQMPREKEQLEKALSCATADSSTAYVEEIFVTQLNIRAWVCTCVFSQYHTHAHAHSHTHAQSSYKRWTHSLIFVLGCKHAYLSPRHNMYVFICASVSVSVSLHAPVRIYVYCMYVCMCMQVCLNMRVRVHVCGCVCVGIRERIRVRTRTRVHMRMRVRVLVQCVCLSNDRSILFAPHCLVFDFVCVYTYVQDTRTCVPRTLYFFWLSLHPIHSPPPFPALPHQYIHIVPYISIGVLWHHTRTHTHAHTLFT